MASLVCLDVDLKPVFCAMDFKACCSRFCGRYSWTCELIMSREMQGFGLMKSPAAGKRRQVLKRLTWSGSPTVAYLFSSHLMSWSSFWTLNIGSIGD